MGAWRWALKLLCSHQGGLLQKYLAKNPLVAAPKQPLPLRVVLGEIGRNAKEPRSRTAEALAPRCIPMEGPSAALKASYRLELDRCDVCHFYADLVSF